MRIDDGSSPPPHPEPVQRDAEEVAGEVVDPIDVVPPFPQAQERVLGELLRVLAVAGDEVEGFEQALALLLEERVETGPCLDQLERDAHGVFLCSHADMDARRPCSAEKRLKERRHRSLDGFFPCATNGAEGEAAVQTAVDRFGRIDVLVNNAGNFHAGFFEEIRPQDFRAQIEVTMFGPMNVARAVLPVMRGQRSGLVVAISSTAGIVGQEFCTAYAASKFGVEGWIESLTPEVAPFGIRTMLVEPGFFRTELLTPESTKFAEPSIDDYAERTEQTAVAWKGMNGQQTGDPAKLANALVQLASGDEPPLRFVAGADAIAAVEQKAKDLLTQADAYRDLSSSLAY